MGGGEYADPVEDARAGHPPSLKLRRTRGNTAASGPLAVQKQCGAGSGYNDGGTETNAKYPPLGPPEAGKPLRGGDRPSTLLRAGGYRESILFAGRGGWRRV